MFGDTSEGYSSDSSHDGGLSHLEFKVGGNSYATGRGGSVGEEGGMNFGWWCGATGVATLCAGELRKRLHSAVEQGEADLDSSWSDSGSSSCSSDGEETGRKKVRRRLLERGPSPIGIPMTGESDGLLAELLGW